MKMPNILDEAGCPKCGSKNILTRYGNKTHNPIERFCLGKEGQDCDYTEEIIQDGADN